MGEWIERWDTYDKGFYISKMLWYECPACGFRTQWKDESNPVRCGYNFCPNCGKQLNQEHRKEKK